MSMTTSENTKVIAIQRSTGYSNRIAFTTDELKIVIKWKMWKD